MNIFKRYNVKRIFLSILWIVMGAGSVVLLAAGIHSKDGQYCKGLEINIRGVSNNFFIDKGDVRKIITSYVGDSISIIKIDKFNLRAMESELKKEVWIKNAELYFDNNDILQASVEEREPVARIFTNTGNSFYIDNSNTILPLSEKLSARLPVFTDFPSDNKILSKPDSSLLNDIKGLSLRIQRDSFLMAMIDQINITSLRNFEMMPKIGDQLIIFGDATEADQKFKKLELFYKKVMLKYGWNRYSTINLQYKGQIVGKLKGKDDVSEDSLRTVEVMRAIAANAARAASDSLQTIIQDNDKNTTDFSIIQQSIERDEGDEPENTLQNMLGTQPSPEPKPIEKRSMKPVAIAAKHGPGINKPPVKPLTKPVVKPKTAPVTPKKNAAPQNKNDY